MLPIVNAYVRDLNLVLKKSLIDEDITKGIYYIVSVGYIASFMTEGNFF